MRENTRKKPWFSQKTVHALRYQTEREWSQESIGGKKDKETRWEGRFQVTMKGCHGLDSTRGQWVVHVVCFGWNPRPLCGYINNNLKQQCLPVLIWSRREILKQKLWCKLGQFSMYFPFTLVTFIPILLYNLPLICLIKYPMVSDSLSFLPSESTFQKVCVHLRLKSSYSLKYYLSYNYLLIWIDQSYLYQVT